jgi:glycerophosphoryl diester phosphodiesterase
MHRRVLAAAVGAVVAVVLALGAPATAAVPGDYATTAHRGYAATTTENSLAALVAAQQAGAPAVEADVRITRDAMFAVMHDQGLARTTHCRGKVHRKTRRRVRSWACRLDNGERVPMVKHLLSRARDLDVNLLLQLKPDPGNRWTTRNLTRLASAVSRYGSPGRVRLLAFDQPLLARAGTATDLETVWIVPYGAWPGAQAAKAAADHVSVGAVDLTPVVAADARGA